jgi:tetratricopeptide (TPR) repeat protein
MRALFSAVLVVLVLGAASAQAQEDRQKAQTALEAGAASYAARDYQEAISHYLDAIKAAPSASGPYRELGKAYDAQGDAKNARFAYEEYLAKKPDAKDAALIRERLSELAEQLEDRDTARAAMEAGAAAYLAKNYREAQRQYQRALDAAPSAASPYRELGKTYDALGEFPQAKRAYETYLTKKPDAADAEQIRARTEAINALFKDRPGVKAPNNSRALTPQAPEENTARNGPRIVGIAAISVLLAGGIITALVVSQNAGDDLLLP